MRRQRTRWPLHTADCPTDRRSPTQRQRGSVLIVAMVLLMLVASLLGASLRTGLMARQRADLDERRAQADWLAGSGLARAAARLEADAGYRGDDWSIPAADLERREGAIVRIAVEPVEGDARRCRVTVRAELAPDSLGSRVVRTRTATLVIGPDADEIDPTRNETQTDQTGPETAPEEDR